MNGNCVFVKYEMWNYDDSREFVENETKYSGALHVCVLFENLNDGTHIRRNEEGRSRTPQSGVAPETKHSAAKIL